MLDSRFTSVSFQQFDLSFRTPHFSSTDFHFGGQQEGEQAPPTNLPHPPCPPVPLTPHLEPVSLGRLRLVQVDAAAANNDIKATLKDAGWLQW